jgi:hypothetical protein
MQTPDSSEIAKHLRAIHLALVLACVLVLMILFGGSPGSIEKAHRQFLDVIAIKENWGSWATKFGHEQLTWLKEKGIVPSNISPSRLFITPTELARRNLATQAHEWVVSTQYALYFYVTMKRTPANVDREEVLAWAQNTDQGIDINYGQSGGEPPIVKSLSDFRSFWTAADSVYVFNVTELSPVVFLVSNGEISNRLSWKETTQASQHSSLELRRTGLGLKRQEKCDALNDKLLSQWRPQFDILFCGASPVEKVEAVVPARVATKRVPVNLRTWLAQEFNFQSVGDSFEKTFSELHHVTQPYQELSLENVKAILEGELSRAGERIQFLGLNVPERSLTSWGIVVIFGIQFYLLLHVWELRSRLAPDDPALNVAWIGLYPGLIARLTSIFTAAVLPVGVQFHLALTQGFSWVTVAVLAVACLAAFITAILLYLIAGPGSR